MHSRRMRTARFSCRLGGGCLPGKCLPRGKGCLPRGRRCLPGGLLRGLPSGVYTPVADLRGGARDVRPPPGGPNSFNFMQFLGKFGKIVCWRPPWGVGAPSSGKSWIRHCTPTHCILKYTPPVNRIADRCKNVTFP